MYSHSGLRNEFSLFGNLHLCRNFHVKTTETEVIKGKDSHGKRTTDSQNNTRFSTFYKCTFFAGSAVTFTFVSFALVDWWKGFINRCTEVARRIEDPEMKFELNDHAVVRGLIVTANLAVFLMWRIPSFNANMGKFTTIGINSGLASAFVPMVLSAFSHTSFLHFFVNMYVLMSFVKAWEHYANSYQHATPKGMMSADKLVAFYLSAGFVANAGSLIVKHIGKMAVPSLGASGAILGLVGYMCCKVPNSLLSIAFIPNFTFSAKSGMIGIATFDTIGLLVGIATRWRYQVFDHAAHLSGLLFGIWYANYGEAMLYKWTEYLRRKRREIRKR